MIQPTEQTPSELGHPMWKRNVFIGLIICAIGVAMMVSVFLFVYGAAVTAIGFAWALVASIIGMMQEHTEMNRNHLPHA